jgi:sarcosine oxidase / L-pipecolate oxidase
MATGGSAHAWKFLPTIGDWVADSIEGKLEPELAEKWSFDRMSNGQDRNAPRMDGKPQELNEVVRHRL